MRYVPDSTWRWVGDDAVLAGSPSRLFRLTPGGAEVASRIERGDDVDRSALVDRLLDAGAIHPAASIGSHSWSASDVTVVTPQFGGIAAPGRLVVDDASDPEIDGARLRLDHNVGPGGARNAGRTLVDTPFVLFVDADVDIPELDADHPGHDRWWSALLHHVDDPRVALVAPRVIGDPRSSLDLGAEPARIRAGTRVSYVPAAAILVRLDAFDDVGGFDETLRVGEDVDLIWRLDDAGWVCRYEPAARASHRPRDGFVASLRQQVKYGSSSAPLALRHPRHLVPYASGIGSATSWSLLAVGRWWIGVATAVLGVARFTLAAPFDRGFAARVAIVGHLAAGQQWLAAIRRAWWPLLLPFLASRRVRRLMALAILAAPRRAARDVAFSVGLWRGVLEHRTLAPVRPRITLGS